MSTYLNGLKRPETVIDDRPPRDLNLDEIESQIRFAKDIGLSKLALHLCTLQTLVNIARSYLDKPKFDVRQGETR